MMFFKIGVLKNFGNFTGKHLCCSLSKEGCRPQTCNFIKKETPTQVFSCEVPKTFKNIFFYGTTLVDASDIVTEIIVINTFHWDGFIFKAMEGRTLMKIRNK